MYRIALSVTILFLLAVATPAAAFRGVISYKEKKAKVLVNACTVGKRPLTDVTTLRFVDRGNGVFSATDEVGTRVDGVFIRKGKNVHFHAADDFFDKSGSYLGSISLAGKAKVFSSGKIKRARIQLHVTDEVAECVVAFEVLAR
jgi:hypothetical protein